MAKEESDETWLDLERLAKRIYRELDPGSTVTHDASLLGHVSETRRQIDVLIENAELGTRVVVDCKDWKRRVDVNDAARFAGLLEDVEATSGVLICNRGFSKAARTVARKKGISLARLHDVESRKWQLDVLIPIIWTELHVAHIGLNYRVYLDRGDAIETDEEPMFLKDGSAVEYKSFIEHAWNSGALRLRRPGKASLSAVLDVQLADGVVRPDVKVDIELTVVGGSRLGRVTPIQARGILDEESQGFSTVSFDVGATVTQEPPGGWTDIFDPEDLALRLSGTVVTMHVQKGLALGPTQMTSIRGAQQHNRHLGWRRTTPPQ